jgi:flagellar protein FliS
MILLFDMLIADLERAISAIAEGNIEKRSSELKHAFTMLQQLEDSLDRENGGQAAETFSAFYAAVRGKLLEAHIKVSPDMLRRQIDLLLEVRQAWQQVDEPNVVSTKISPDPSDAVAQQPVVVQEQPTTSSDWTA